MPKLSQASGSANPTIKPTLYNRSIYSALLEMHQTLPDIRISDETDEKNLALIRCYRATLRSLFNFASPLFFGRFGSIPIHSLERSQIHMAISRCFEFGVLLSELERELCGSEVQRVAQHQRGNGLLEAEDLEEAVPNTQAGIHAEFKKQFEICYQRLFDIHRELKSALITHNPEPHEGLTRYSVSDQGSRSGDVSVPLSTAGGRSRHTATQAGVSPHLASIKTLPDYRAALDKEYESHIGYGVAGSGNRKASPWGGRVLYHSVEYRQVKSVHQQFIDIIRHFISLAGLVFGLASILRGAEKIFIIPFLQWDTLPFFRISLGIATGVYASGSSMAWLGNAAAKARYDYLQLDRCCLPGKKDLLFLAAALLKFAINLVLFSIVVNIPLSIASGDLFGHFFEPGFGNMIWSFVMGGLILKHLKNTYREFEAQQRGMPFIVDDATIAYASKTTSTENRLSTVVGTLFRRAETKENLDEMKRYLCNSPNTFGQFGLFLFLYWLKPLWKGWSEHASFALSKCRSEKSYKETHSTTARGLHLRVE